jgi:hypothetical protein
MCVNRSRSTPPEFPVERDGFREVHAAFLDESRTRGHLWCRVVRNPGPVDKS